MMKRHAFTLVELMVVLAVIAIISTLTFGVISNTVTSNRRATCAANMSQIYGALRLYSQDYDGQFPYFNPVETGVASSPTPTDPPLPQTLNLRSGLWSLIYYPNGTKTGYLKNSETLYSPVDPSERRADEPNQPSYQFLEEETTPPQPPVWTYATFRQGGGRRQLWPTNATETDKLQRRPSDTTVVMWSRWHRRLDSNNNYATIDLSDKSNRDNVLFLDGRVQSIAATQLVSDTSGNSGTCTVWKRVPQQMEFSLANAANCEPSN